MCIMERGVVLFMARADESFLYHYDRKAVVYISNQNSP